MATDVPQRDLRNNTAELLRRVERGERLRITVHGHPVAELGPLESAAVFVRGDELRRGFAGLLDADDPLDEELRTADDETLDPFA
ncbi:MAG: type II toxin-antitoxin system Phd/YefM family antitoxin [Solirubrobacterales bacterium]